MSEAIPVILAFVLAFLCESLTEYLFGTLADKIPALKPFRWLLMYLAALFGVLLSFYYAVDLVALLIGAESSWVGVLLSGLSIGRGSNYLHQFLGKFLPSIKG